MVFKKSIIEDEDGMMLDIIEKSRTDQINFLPI